MRTVILGCGISGLISTHIIKDSIALESSNKVASNFLDNLFPKYIHNKDITLKLCEEIGITPMIENFVIGVFYDRKLYDFYDKNISDIKSQMYEAYCIKKYGKLIDNKMNGFMNNDTAASYIKNKEEIIDKLYELNKDRIRLNCNVTKIDTDLRKIYVGDEVIEYDRLISTIPLHIYKKLSGSAINYTTLKLKLSVARVNKLPFNYDFIYVPDKYTFHRINIDKSKNVITFEMASCSFIDDCYTFLDLFKIKLLGLSAQEFVFPMAESIQVPDVIFLGRFAKGDYTLKLEEIISESQNLEKNWKINMQEL